MFSLPVLSSFLPSFLPFFLSIQPEPTATLAPPSLTHSFFHSPLFLLVSFLSFHSPWIILSPLSLFMFVSFHDPRLCHFLPRYKLFVILFLTLLFLLVLLVPFSFSFFSSIFPSTYPFAASFHSNLLLFRSSAPPVLFISSLSLSPPSYADYFPFAPSAFCFSRLFPHRRLTRKQFKTVVQLNVHGETPFDKVNELNCSFHGQYTCLNKRLCIRLNKRNRAF